MKKLPAVTVVRRRFMRNTCRVVCAVLLLSALPPLPADAAPARSTTLNAATRQFKWHDGPRTTTGAQCVITNRYRDVGVLPIDDPACTEDDTLINLKKARGRLRIRAVATEDLPDGVRYRPDIDMYLYRSDANGVVGKEVGRNRTVAPIETIQISRARAGYYLVRVQYYSGAQMSYDGTATWKPRGRPRR